MREFTVAGYSVNVGDFKKLLAYQGSSNCETVCFTMGRYCGDVDLMQCSCTIKTKNSEGKSDIIQPKTEVQGDEIKVFWKISSASTLAVGKLLAQIQFEKITDDTAENFIWQSNIMEFEISGSLDSADEVYDQNPSLFQQWEERVNSAYSDVSSSVNAAQILADQVQAAAGAVSEQEQNILQIQAQVSQTAAEAQSSLQSAAEKAGDTSQSAARAAESEANALTAENLSKEYSNDAKTYAGASEASASAAQQQAASAKSDADRAQQTAAAFTGYTKQESDNRFANALIGEVTGQSVTLGDMQANTGLCSLLVTGATAETGTGTKSPSNPYTLNGVTKVTISHGTSSQDYPLPQKLYSLSGGLCDTYDILTGEGTQTIREITLNGSENWTENAPWNTQYPNYFHAFCGMASWKVGQTAAMLSHFRFYGYPSGTTLLNTECAYCSTTNSSLYLFIPATALPVKNVSGLKSWLAANPVTVLYALDTQKQISGSPSAVLCPPNSTAAADSGTVDVKYVRDINSAYQELYTQLQNLKGQ